MSSNFSTHDTLEASFLWCQEGVSYTGVSVTRERKRLTVTFHFLIDEEKVDIDELRRNYYNGKSSVEPKSFVNKMNDVKSILYAELKSK